MPIYDIDKRHYKNITPHQLEDMLRRFDVDDKGTIHIPFVHKGYTCADVLNTPLKNVKALSMFSGAGGLDIGARLAGVSILSTLDNYGDSVRTLEENKLFQGALHEEADITTLRSDHYSELLKRENPEKLIIIGGPPCQPFSKAGYWVTNEKRSSNDDPRNMIQPYFNAIAEIQPDGFVLENVESILHPSNKAAVENIFENMERLGYYYSTLKINAAEYGIPQKRKRVFFLASKNPIDANITKTHGSEKECASNPDLLPFERVIDWIGIFDDPIFWNNESLGTEGKWENALTCIPFGKNYIALSARDGHPNPLFVAGKRYWSSLLKLDPTLPSWTIIASPGHWEGPFHWKNRRLSIRELAAIQTFPDDYKFFGTVASQHKQIGNAVPPLLGKLIVEELIKWL